MSAPWSASRGAVAPGPSEVHVWRIALDDDVPDQARAALSADERSRADRFRFERLSRRFVAGRAALRAILARCTGVDPASLEFEYSPHGKPSLASRPGIAFNLSHSSDLALCAVTGGADVGVDVEHLRSGRNPFDQIDGYFSAAERAAIIALPPDRRRDACFACWTRKEAFLKARGDGLSLALDSFDVECTPGAPPRIIAARGAAHDGRPWSVVDAGPIEGFAAAVVVEGSSPRLCRWSWTWRDDNPAD